MIPIELDYQNFLGKTAEEKCEGLWVNLIHFTAKLPRPISLYFGCEKLRSIFRECHSRAPATFDGGEVRFIFHDDLNLKPNQIRINDIVMVELDNYENLNHRR